MAAYDVIQQFAAPAATVFASITAATVTAIFAIKQWKVSDDQALIAFDKIKIEVMKPRMEVLTATRALIRLALHSDGDAGPDPVAMQSLQRTIDDGRFLFSNETKEYLKTISNKCFDAVNFAPHPVGYILSPEEVEAKKERAAARRFIMREAQRLPAMLEDEISPTHLIDNSRLKRKGETTDKHDQNIRTRVATLGITGLVGLVFLLFALAVSIGRT